MIILKLKSAICAHLTPTFCDKITDTIYKHAETDRMKVDKVIIIRYPLTLRSNTVVTLLGSKAKQGAAAYTTKLVKLSRWRAKKSGPKFKMKIVFCISTNIQHDMHCFCFPELNVEPGIPKLASRSCGRRGGTRRAPCPSVRCLGVLLCTSVLFYITNTAKAL